MLQTIENFLFDHFSAKKIAFYIMLAVLEVVDFIREHMLPALAAVLFAGLLFLSGCSSPAPGVRVICQPQPVEYTQAQDAAMVKAYVNLPPTVKVFINDYLRARDEMRACNNSK